MKKALGFVGVLAIAAALYNAVAIINFAAKYPEAQNQTVSWIGVVTPLVIGVTVMLWPLRQKKIRRCNGGKNILHFD